MNAFKTSEREGKIMSLKRIFGYILIFFLIMHLFSPAVAQMKEIFKFKEVYIPFNLKHDNSIIKKGKYDFEFRKDPIQHLYYLRIKTKRKTLCMIKGEELNYESSGYYEKLADPNIPEECKLKFQRIPDEGIVNIIFESGKRIRVYPCIKIKFRMEYEQ